MATYDGLGSGHFDCSCHRIMAHTEVGVGTGFGKGKGETVEAVKVKMIGSDGSITEVTTGKDGAYNFKLRETFINRLDRIRLRN